MAFLDGGSSAHGEEAGEGVQERSFQKVSLLISPAFRGSGFCILVVDIQEERAYLDEHDDNALGAKGSLSSQRYV